MLGLWVTGAGWPEGGKWLLQRASLGLLHGRQANEVTAGANTGTGLIPEGHPHSHTHIQHTQPPAPEERTLPQLLHDQTPRGLAKRDSTKRNILLYTGSFQLKYML